MSGPTGNTAELVKDLNELSGQNASALNVFSAALGTLADASGAIGGIVSAIEGIVSLFNPNQPDAYLAKVLSAIQQYLVAMYTDIEARFQEQVWQQLSTLIGTAEGVAQSLPNLINAQPPLTDDEKVGYIVQCLGPVNTLTDTTNLPQGSFFVTTYSSMTYYTDAGLYMTTNSPFVDSNNNVEFSPFDAGYGPQAPPQPANDQVFSYLYVLAYCVKAYAMLIAAGTAFYPDFGQNAQRWQSALISFAQFLTMIHNTIAGAITRLAPADPNASSDWGNAASYGQTGIMPVWSNPTPDNPNNYNVFGYTFIIGAVEKYSGYSSINSTMTWSWPVTSPAPLSSSYEQVYQKLQVRALREMIKVYNAIGLFQVWSVINDLNQLTQQAPLPRHPYATWSFREIFSQAAVPKRSDGSLHLSDLATRIAQSPLVDTAQTAPPYSWRGLLEPS